jgi:hypothetical protein
MLTIDDYDSNHHESHHEGPIEYEVDWQLAASDHRASGNEAIDATPGIGLGCNAITKDAPRELDANKGNQVDPLVPQSSTGVIITHHQGKGALRLVEGISQTSNSLSRVPCFRRCNSHLPW